MASAINMLKGKVPQGIYQGVELLIKTVKRDEFCVAESKDEEGKSVFLFCSFERQPNGAEPIVRVLCEIIPQEEVTNERPVNLKNPFFQ
jgi:hypothetical protein